jgi:chitinase
MLTFAPGQTSRTITVTVRDDTLVEADETFFVNLSQASGATIAAGRATGTIRNDDQPPPGLSIASVRAVEGSGLFVFTVTLSSLSTQPVTVRYATANGTAVAGSRGDYTATSGTLRFNPGETVKTIAVAVRNDSLVERDETFFVNLSQPTAASIQTGRATGTILDDDRVSVANWAAFAGLASSPGAAGGKQRPFAAG